MTLKEQLLQIKQNSPSIISNKLLFEMVENIGSLDSELRDTLIYSLFSDWTTTGKLSVNQEQKVSSFLLDNSYLLQNIDNKNDKLSIFTALFLASLSYRHNNHSFLSQSQQRQIIEQSIDYIQNEHDFRGLTNDGWAHGIAILQICSMKLLISLLLHTMTASLSLTPSKIFYTIHFYSQLMNLVEWSFQFCI